MDSKVELKTIAVKARHAFEELCLDCAYTKANQIYSAGATAMFQYLRRELYGTRWRTVKALRAMLREAGEVVPKIDRHDVSAVRAERRRIKTCAMWVLEESVYEAKRQEAVARFGSLNQMLSYLLEHYGDVAALLPALRVAAQRPRRKS